MSLKSEEIWNEIRPELKARVQAHGGMKPISKEIGVSYDTLRSWLNGKNPPKFVEMLELLKLLKYGNFGDSLLSAVLGHSGSGEDEVFWVNEYDVTLSAGDGRVNGHTNIISRHPFSADLLQEIAGTLDTSQLGLLSVVGDSMQPTIKNGSKVLVDFRQTSYHDGIYAIAIWGEARVKRLKFVYNGMSIISDNESVYGAEVLHKDRMNEIKIIGKVIWSAGNF